MNNKISKNIGYKGIHTWIRKRKIKLLCEICNKKKDKYGSSKLELANISGLYKRDLDDWIYCHHYCHTQEHLKGNHKNIKYKRIRNLIRKRDNYTCQICFKLQYNPQLVVHHIDFDKKNDDEKNLISVCVSCHKKLHKGVKYGK
jgi:5-methylcytosine-specific restriction endonuclease McrA